MGKRLKLARKRCKVWEEIEAGQRGKVWGRD